MAVSLTGWVRTKVADPRIVKHLLTREGEQVIDEVRHHWVVYALTAFDWIGAVLVLAATLSTPLDRAWLPISVALVLAAHGGWNALNQSLDRFVITNMRVFRVRGVLDQRIATMPIARILDITVDKPLAGRILGFGHFTFESAAKSQGVREIRYIGRPDERDLTIQSVLQRAGLRATVDGGQRDDGSGTNDGDLVLDEAVPSRPLESAAQVPDRPRRGDHPRLHPIQGPDRRYRPASRPSARPRPPTGGDGQPAPEQPAPEQPVLEQPAPEQPAPEQPAPEQPAPEQPLSGPAEEGGRSDQPGG